MHVTSYDICVPGFERLRNNTEILLPIIVSNETSAESIREAMADEIQAVMQENDFDYDAAEAALAAFWTEEGNHIMRHVRDLEPMDEADAWTADAYCHLWIYLCAATVE